MSTWTRFLWPEVTKFPSSLIAVLFWFEDVRRILLNLFTRATYVFRSIQELQGSQGAFFDYCYIPRDVVASCQALPPDEGDFLTTYVVSFFSLALKNGRTHPAGVLDRDGLPWRPRREAPGGISAERTAWVAAAGDASRIECGKRGELSSFREDMEYIALRRM